MTPIEANLNLTAVQPRHRHFTVEQADRALVLIRRIVADVIVDYQRLLDLNEVMEAACAAGGNDRIEACRDALLSTVEKLQNCLGELAEIGVELRDWGLGVVDFPAMADGREVFLCWQFGEPRVMHWHEQEAGDAGRQSLDTLPVPTGAISE